MKEFKKNNVGLFICEECGKECKDKTVLSIHNIKIHHISVKEYFDKWIKEKGDDICVICGNITKLIRNDVSYKKCCCKKCENIYSGIRTKEAIFEKFGVENVYQLESIKEKCKKVKFNKYGDEKYQNRNKIEQTNLERYGVKTPFQNEVVWNKTQINSLRIKKFRNTNIWYQGTYELNFLNKYYDKYPEIQRGPSIKYSFDNINKLYYPDFYIPSLNLIIEIKSNYWYRIHKLNILEKEKATISNGFNYIIIIDKNYYKFDLYLKTKALLSNLVT